MKIILSMVIALLIVAAALEAAPNPPLPELESFPHPKGYVCTRVNSPIVIDGKLTDEAWVTAPWTDAFGDIEGDVKPKPRFATRVKMLWDDEALYIAAEIDEPDVWATLTEHDSVIFHDNDFEVFIDPDGDNHVYGELEINALNTTWDLLLTKPYKDDGRAINGWEISGLKTAVHVNGTMNQPGDIDRGWSIEIRWPWSGLREMTHVRTPPRDGDQWRINFSRVEWDIEIAGGKYRKVKGKPEHNWVWSPQGVIDMHRPERWGYLQFSTAAPGKSSFQTDPNWPVRDLLHRVYYAERSYRKSNGKYSGSLTDLGLGNATAPLAGPVRVETTEGGFEASVTIPGTRGARPRRWFIRQDSHIGVE